VVLTGSSPHRKSWSAFFVATSAALALVVWGSLAYRGIGAHLRGEGVPNDFQVYFQAAQKIGVPDAKLYEPDAAYPYKYSPAFAVLIRGIGSDLAISWLFFKGISLLILAGVFGLLMRRSAPAGVLLALLVGWQGWMETLDVGQSEFLLLAGAALGFALRAREKSFSAGFVLGLLPLVKLPWAAAMVAIPRRGWGWFVCGYVAATFFWVIVLPSISFGPVGMIEQTRAWLSSLGAQPRGLYSDPHNQSLWATLSRWVESEIALSLLFALLAGGLTWASVRLVRKTQRERADAWVQMTALLCWIQLLSPLGWRWATWVVFPVILAFPWTRRSAIWAIAGGGIALAQTNDFARLLGYGHRTELAHWGLATVLWVWGIALCCKALRDTKALSPTQEPG
jgi:hypothetical protein